MLDGLDDNFGVLVVAAVFLFAVLVVLAQTVRIVSQGNAGIVERLGRTRRSSRRTCRRSSGAAASW